MDAADVPVRVRLRVLGVVTVRPREVAAAAEDLRWRRVWAAAVATLATVLAFSNAHDWARCAEHGSWADCGFSFGSMAVLLAMAVTGAEYARRYSARLRSDHDIVEWAVTPGRAAGLYTWHTLLGLGVLAYFSLAPGARVWLYTLFGSDKVAEAFAAEAAAQLAGFKGRPEEALAAGECSAYSVAGAVSQPPFHALAQTACSVAADTKAVRAAWRPFMIKSELHPDTCPGACKAVCASTYSALRLDNMGSWGAAFADNCKKLR